MRKVTRLGLEPRLFWTKPGVLPVTPSGKKIDNKNKNLKQRYKIRANVLNQIIDPKLDKLFTKFLKIYYEMNYIKINNL